MDFLLNDFGKISRKKQRKINLKISLERFESVELEKKNESVRNKGSENI